MIRIAMTDDLSERERARQARLRSALRENLARRKSQARGRKGHAIVTPEDDQAASTDPVPGKDTD